MADADYITTTPAQHARYDAEVRDHTPLIEQLETWAQRLEGESDIQILLVAEEMRQTAADLRAEDANGVKA